MPLTCVFRVVNVVRFTLVGKAQWRGGRWGELAGVGAGLLCRKGRQGLASEGGRWGLGQGDRSRTRPLAQAHARYGMGPPSVPVPDVSPAGQVSEQGSGLRASSVGRHGPSCPSRSSLVGVKRGHQAHMRFAQGQGRLNRARVTT